MGDQQSLSSEEHASGKRRSQAGNRLQHLKRDAQESISLPLEQVPKILSD